MNYPLLTFQQARQLSGPHTVMFSGRIRCAGCIVYLEQGDISLRLIGQPFSGLLLPGQHLDIWGEYLPGKQPVFLVHDARRAGDVLRQPQVIPSLRVGMDVLWPMVRVLYHANEQLALTPDGQIVVLYGEELDQRHYAVEAKMISVNPPVAVILGAVPLTPLFWSAEGAPA